MKLKNKTNSAVVEDLYVIEFIYDDDNYDDKSAKFDIIGAIAHTNGEYDELFNYNK